MTPNNNNINNNPNPSGAGHGRELALAGLARLNERLGTTYTVKPGVVAYLDRAGVGYTCEDVRRMVDAKIEDWANDEKMFRNLVPSTLFGPKHFEEYMESAKIAFDGPKPGGRAKRGKARAAMPPESRYDNVWKADKVG